MKMRSSIGPRSNWKTYLDCVTIFPFTKSHLWPATLLQLVAGYFLCDVLIGQRDKSLKRELETLPLARACPPSPVPGGAKSLGAAILPDGGPHLFNVPDTGL